MADTHRAKGGFHVPAVVVPKRCGGGGGGGKGGGVFEEEHLLSALHWSCTFCTIALMFYSWTNIRTSVIRLHSPKVPQAILALWGILTP